jgi:hypothetical protein
MTSKNWTTGEAPLGYYDDHETMTKRTGLVDVYCTICEHSFSEKITGVSLGWFRDEDGAYEEIEWEASETEDCPSCGDNTVELQREDYRED